MNYKDIPLGENSPEVVNTIVEITKGQHNKYEYDPEIGGFKLDRVLHGAMFYPADYGYIPQTLADDGDPLDMFIIMENPTFTGCIVEVRPLGYLEMIDGGENDEKLIGVPANDPKSTHIKTISDLPPFVLDEIAHFLATYKQLEKKETKIGDWKTKKEAFEMIRKTYENYKNQK